MFILSSYLLSLLSYCNIEKLYNILLLVIYGKFSVIKGAIRRKVFLMFHHTPMRDKREASSKLKTKTN